mmetsp:Transcript_25660/g.38740  ORF Transcript_25660/g.38740 Transcript_25660/m.38740 type:complete len:629 (+) Transcript_25660:158-2044(+)
MPPFSTCNNNKSACCITNANSNNPPSGEVFLKSLSNANELSIRLIEFRSPQNTLKGKFRLEVRATTATENKEKSSFSLELDGVKDPKSSWPNYIYRAAEAQEDFLLNLLLPALSKNIKDNKFPLQSLTIQGCGRVKDFYTMLFHTVFDSNDNKNTMTASKMSLSILNWADFCSSVDWVEILKLPINAQELHVEYGPKMETETFTKLCEFLQTNHEHLQRLYLKTGTACFSDKWWLPQWKKTFEKLRNQLTDLTWLTFYNSPLSSTQVSSIFDQISLHELCHIWRQSLSCRRLNLTGHSLDASMLKILSAEDEPSFSLEELSIRIMRNDEDEFTTMLGSFVQKHRNLGCLRVLFPSSNNDVNNLSSASDGSIQPLFELCKDHPTLHTLKLENVPSTCLRRKYNDSASLPIRSLLGAKSSALQHISIGLQLSSNQEQHQEQSRQLLPFYRSLFEGLRDNNGTLESLRLSNCGIISLDDVHVCRSIHEAFVLNSTVRLLDFGNVRILNNIETISQGLMHNQALERLLGLYFIDIHAHDYHQNQQQQLLWQDILQYNKTLLTIPTTSFTKSPMVDYYLKLNRHVGRRYWVNSNFSAALVSPVLAKAAANNDLNILHFLLRTKPELINCRKPM